MNEPWHRCSPAAGFYFFLANLRGLINLWPALAVLVASDGWRNAYVWAGAAVLMVVLMVLAAMQWWRYRFQYDDRQIQIYSGLLNRKRLSLDFDRVQEAGLSQPWYFRPFNLWHLGLESAGSASQEVKVPGIAKALAEDVRERFRRYKAMEKGASESKTTATETITKPEFELQLTPADLLRYGLMHNSLIYLVPVLGTLLGSSEMSDWLVDRARETHLFEWFSALQGAGVVALLILGAMLVIAALVVLYGLSVLLSIARYWRYHLTVKDQQFQYQAGLFNRLDRGFKQHKLQSVVIKQSVIARLLNRYSVELQQANDTTGHSGLGGFLIPVLTADELAQLREMLQLKEGAWQLTEAARIGWNTLTYGTLAMLAWFVAGWLVGWISPWLSGLAYFVVGGLSYLSWRRNKYFESDGWVAIQTGFLGYRQTYIPAIKIQKLELTQGPLLRQHGCAAFKVWSGAKAADIAFVKQSRLAEVRDSLLAQVGGHQGRWM